MQNDQIDELLSALDTLYKYASDEGCPNAEHHRFSRPNRARNVIEVWLQSLVEPTPPAQWQPIETAPKTGGEILVHDEGATFISWWSEDDNAWMDSSGAPGSQRVEPPPQFWMPIPTAPMGVS